ncbi:DUF5004 domain-containing protein [Solitalea sp. MAHUQ-68]|uniref:DUF5004 domain-containing protein n=1 Tax=Solitalea agri TaxID=2953739 RepID=A0A9X2F8N9_9SPHI|nr:DUF5004 domain-containing protein [Solitalea agri]MCO4294391.1 DUF5004 domain-containing protein [Solitalea agri]
MKKILSTAIILLPMVLSIVSCQPEDVKPVGEPVNIVSGLSGEWSTEQVIQIDNDAVKKGFPYQRLDITSLYPYTTMKLILSTDNDGNPTTFSFDPGSAPSLIPISSGDWSVDSEIAPSVITLTNGGNSVDVQIANYTSLRNDELVLKVVKTLSGKPVLTYEYHFKK